MFLLCTTNPLFESTRAISKGSFQPWSLQYFVTRTFMEFFKFVIEVTWYIFHLKTILPSSQPFYALNRYLIVRIIGDALWKIMAHFVYLTHQKKILYMINKYNSYYTHSSSMQLVREKRWEVSDICLQKETFSPFFSNQLRRINY